MAQTYHDIEVLLINDGSTDNSKAICSEYEATYSNIHLMNKENGGVSDARNWGILHATGDYIIFVDPDDYWDTDFLHDLVDYIKQNKAIDYLFFRYTFYFQRRNVYKEKKFNIERENFWGKSGEESLGYILGKMSDFQWLPVTCLVRRDFLVENELFFVKGRIYEDILWTPHLFLQAKAIDFYDKPVYIYRLEREGQLTSQITASVLNDNIFIVTSWYQYLQQATMDSSLKIKLMNNFIDRYYFCIKFIGFVESVERKQILSTVRENRFLLHYKNNILHTITSVLCKMIGFQATAAIFKVLIICKRKMIIRN